MKDCVGLGSWLTNSRGTHKSSTAMFSSRWQQNKIKYLNVFTDKRYRPERRKNTAYLHDPSSKKKVYSGTPESRNKAAMAEMCSGGIWSLVILCTSRVKNGISTLSITIYLTSDLLFKNGPGKLHFKHFPMCSYFQLAHMGKWYHYLGGTHFKSCLEQTC